MSGDLQLLSKLHEVFLKNDASVADAQVLAALITAASKMAGYSEVQVTEEMTAQQLLDLYGRADDEKVTELIGMGPQYVAQNIGYSVDFNDFSVANANYKANKNNYDSVYRQVALRADQMESQRKPNTL